MQQSTKQQVITSSIQQLACASFAEAMSQTAALGDSQHSGAFTSVQEQLKSIPKKSYRS